MHRENPTPWHTRIHGTTYRLTENGRLQPAQRKTDMATTHIERMTNDRERDAQRAVHEELLALAIRRMEQHAKEQQ